MDVWWIDEPFMLGSSNPSTEDLAALRSHGFDVLVSLLREEEQPPYYDVDAVVALGYVRRNIPVRDFSAPEIGQMREFLDFVSKLPAGSKVVVHCHAGIGRTGTFAAAWWISKGESPLAAVSRIRGARSYAVETGEQVAALEELARQLGGDAGSRV